MHNPSHIRLLGVGAVTERLHPLALDRLGWITGCEVVDPNSSNLDRSREPWLASRINEFNEIGNFGRRLEQNTGLMRRINCYLSCTDYSFPD
jgi:hypothetical protein